MTRPRNALATLLAATSGAQTTETRTLSGTVPDYTASVWLYVGEPPAPQTP